MESMLERNGLMILRMKSLSIVITSIFICFTSTSPKTSISNYIYIDMCVCVRMLTVRGFL